MCSALAERSQFVRLRRLRNFYLLTSISIFFRVFPGLQKLLDGEDPRHGGHAQQRLHRVGVADDHLPDDGEQQHVHHRVGGVEGQ